jgi:hypothetical protein
VLCLVIEQIRSLDRIRCELFLDGREHIGEILELALERPFAGDLKVVDIGEAHVGRRSGIKR